MPLSLRFASTSHMEGRVRDRVVNKDLILRDCVQMKDQFERRCPAAAKSDTCKAQPHGPVEGPLYGTACR